MTKNKGGFIMCKFCNYSEGNVADEDIINKRIRIGENPDALGMEIYVNEDYDGKPYLIGNLFIPCVGESILETSTEIKYCPMCGRKL